MVKAFDLGELVKRLEANGLVIVEKEAKDATAVLLDWVSDSLVLEGGALGAIAVPVIAVIKPLILKIEDKIDAVEGN